MGSKNPSNCERKIALLTSAMPPYIFNSLRSSVIRAFFNSRPKLLSFLNWQAVVVYLAYGAINLLIDNPDKLRKSPLVKLEGYKKWVSLVMPWKRSTK